MLGWLRALPDPKIEIYGRATRMYSSERRTSGKLPFSFPQSERISATREIFLQTGSLGVPYLQTGSHRSLNS